MNIQHYSAEELESYFDACEDSSPDDDTPDVSEFIGGYPEEKFSPDDFEDGFGTHKTSNLLHDGASYNGLLGLFKRTKSLYQRKSKGPFLFHENKKAKGFSGAIERADVRVAEIRLNTDSGHCYELGGIKFIDKFMKILNGKDKDPLLRLYRPRDFEFLYHHEWIHFKAGRKSYDFERLCDVFGVELLYFGDKERVGRILKKALMKALVREGLDQWGREILPKPTRTIRKCSRRLFGRHTLH